MTVPVDVPFKLSILDWFIVEIAYFLCLSINVILLVAECNKRRRVTLPTAMSKWCPLLSLLSGTAYGLFGCLHFITFVCNPTAKPFLIAAGFQGIFVGFYQLDRLYSMHVYPFPAFVFMTLYGLLLALWTLIFPWMFATSTCELNAGTLVVRMRFTAVITVSLLLYVVWDVTTLLLYAVKLHLARRNVRNNNHEFQSVYYRVVCTLQRILVLTIMYDVMTLIWMACTFIQGAVLHNVTILQYLLAIAASIVMSLCVFLMQPHNAKEYNTFLKLFGKSKLYFVCCCCCKALIQREIWDNTDGRNATSEETSMQESDDDVRDVYVQM